jgi:hypothetical protein
MRGHRGAHPISNGLVATHCTADLRFCLWGGLDSNQRPTDYESGHGEPADLQEFLNVLVRNIT